MECIIPSAAKPEILLLVIDQTGKLVHANRAAKSFLDLPQSINESSICKHTLLSALLHSAGMLCTDKKILTTHLIHTRDFEFSMPGCERVCFRCNADFHPGDQDNHLTVTFTIISDLQQNIEQLEQQNSSLLERNSYLTNLTRIASGMLSKNDLEILLQQITKDIVSSTCADGAYLHMVHETQDFLEVVAATGPLRDDLMGATRLRDVGFSAIAWETGETQFTNDYYNHEACVLEDDGDMQTFAIPLKHADRVLGVAYITCSDPTVDLYSHNDLLHQISEIAALAISKANMLRRANRELGRSRALSELSANMYHLHDIDTLLDVVSQTLIAQYSLARVKIYRSTSDAEIVTTSSWTHHCKQARHHRLAKNDIDKNTIAWWSLSNGKGAFIGRSDEDPRESDSIRKSRHDQLLGCTLCLPIILHNSTRGVFVINRAHNQRDLGEGEIHAIKTVTHQLAAALVRQELYDKIHHQAHHDSLTDLPNRRAFENELQESVENSLHPTSHLAVLFIDLDEFKTVNDTLGHSIGDKLLQAVAGRFRNLLPEKDILCRMGGDEFAVIIKQLNARSEALTIANCLADSLNTPFEVEGSQLKIGASVGLCFSPRDGNTATTLLRNSDIAMYQAKSDRQHSIQCFNQGLADQSRHRLLLAQDLREAIDQHQFELVYQPQIDSRSARVSGAEALIRWNHPTRGVISPGEFIPVAEETGLISSIGAWVLSQACTHLAGWHAAGHTGLCVSVNIAAPQFLLNDFPETVMANLDRHNLDPCYLELEVTESIVMRDVSQIIERLSTLRSAGVKIAVDDFGTGYSSLSYLQDLPLDVLKIDRSFIIRLTSMNAHKSLVNTIMSLASNLGLETVAEGVETVDQLQSVVSLGCNRIQGYYYSKPVSEKDLLATLVGLDNTLGSTAKAA